MKINHIRPFSKLNQTNGFKDSSYAKASVDKEVNFSLYQIGKFTEIREIRLDHLKMGNAKIPFSRLNQPNGFKDEVNFSLYKIGEFTEIRKIRLDHLKMGNGIKAFTLFELSIVIIIIGGLLGIMVVSDDYIRQSRLRAVIAEADELQAAIAIFETRYNHLPGDFPSASSFFPECTDDTTINIMNTCDGNGDGMLTGARSSAHGSVMFQEYLMKEPWRAMEHLSHAKLTSASFTGKDNATNQGRHIAGENVIKSKMTDVVILPINFNVNSPPYTAAQDVVSLEGTVTGGELAPLIIGIGRIDPASRYTMSGALSGRDAYFIDNKLDDGLANRGKVIGGRSFLLSGTECLDGTGVNYQLSESTVRTCNLGFVIRN